MAVYVNPEGLTAAGTRLAGTTASYAPAMAVAPGADQTSASAAAQLNATSAALVARLNHASLLRELGGQAVANTAATLVSQDEANAQAIANGATAPGFVGGLISAPHVPAPTLPDVPQLPAALLPLPGEAHAQSLYGGPGSASMYQFADQWAHYGDQLNDLATHLDRTGHSINDNSDRGEQRAGANTIRHGTWVAQMGQHAHSLAGYARTVAECFDSAKANTPSPQEFAQTRSQLQAAMQRFAATKGANAAEVQQITHKYANQQAEATGTVTAYHQRVTGVSFSTAGAADAPPITGGEPGPAPAGGPLPLNDPGDLWDPSTAHKLFNSLNECEGWILARQLLYPWEKWQCHVAGPGGVAGLWPSTTA